MKSFFPNMKRLLLCISVLVLISHGYTQKVNFANDTEALKDLQSAVNKFSINFFKVALDNESSNFISSPVSIFMVLAMATYGAKGITKEELQTVLHLPNNKETTLTSIESINHHLNMFQPVYLRLGNKMFANDDLRVNGQYQRILSSVFHSPVQNLNFGYRLEAASIINMWSKLFTHGNIDEIVDPDDLDPTTALILLNSVYFKGNWKVSFNPEDTTNNIFYINENLSKSVPMMSKVDELKYGDLPNLDATFIELPYEDGNEPNDASYMYIILPNKVEGIAKLEEQIDDLKLADLQSGNLTPIVLQLPKFRIESTLRVKDNLIQLGIKNAFTGDADFTGITDSGRSLAINDVIQKAFIDINEEGTEAGASTLLDLGFRISDDVYFNVNHPFLIVIAINDIILFAAKVMDPTA